MTIYIDDRLGKGLRSFLRQIMSNAALDDPVSIFAREFIGIGTGIRVRCTVVVTFKRDGRHGNDRACGKPFFEVIILRLALCEILPPAVVMDHDGDMIWGVEGRSTSIERSIVELPLRRSLFPDELRKIMRVFPVAVLTPFGGEVKLIPPLGFSRRRQRRLPGCLAAD